MGSNPNMVPWLRSLAEKGDKGGVTNVDARSLGRVADEIERLEDEIDVQCSSQFVEDRLKDIERLEDEREERTDKWMELVCDRDLEIERLSAEVAELKTLLAEAVKWNWLGHGDNPPGLHDKIMAAVKEGDDDV